MQASGKAAQSFTLQHLLPDDGPPADAEQEDLILWTAGGLFTGGSDTVCLGTIACYCYILSADAANPVG